MDCVVFDINFTDENHENDENDGCFTYSSSWQTKYDLACTVQHPRTPLFLGRNMRTLGRKSWLFLQFFHGFSIFSQISHGFSHVFPPNGSSQILHLHRGPEAECCQVLLGRHGRGAGCNKGPWGSPRKILLGENEWKQK